MPEAMNRHKPVDRIKFPTMEELKKVKEKIIPLENKIRSLRNKVGTVKRTEKKHTERRIDITIKDLAKPNRKKELMKVLSEINDPHYAVALIVHLEAVLAQLEPDFESYTPKRE